MIWRRYIADTFFIWEHGEESLEKFLNKLNTFHPTIKFTAEYSKEAINFLDVNVRLVEGELMTDFFVKPTDTHQFLDPSSSHPCHCKKGIPYSQALKQRFRRMANGKRIQWKNDKEAKIKSPITFQKRPP